MEVEAGVSPEGACEGLGCLRDGLETAGWRVYFVVMRVWEGVSGGKD